MPKTSTRYIEIMLEKRHTRCVARLLDKDAPKTCEAIWRALPQGGHVFHAKYASNEIFTLAPVLPEMDLVQENRTITPIPGDVMHFYLPPATRIPPEALDTHREGQGVTDLAVFYDRNNLLLSPSEGFTPGNVFGAIVRGLDEMKSAGHSIWREGPMGDKLLFKRLEGADLKHWGLE